MHPTSSRTDHLPRRLALCLLLTAMACSPTTRYRQSLFTAPAAPPPHLGLPLEPGRVAVGGSAAGYMVTSPDPTSVVNMLLPSTGDPGVFLPPITLGGHVRTGVTPNTELGVSALYANYDQSVASSIGVLPLVDPRPLLGIMPQLTFGGLVDEHIGLAGTLEAGRLFTPYSRYRIIDDEAIGSLAPGSAEALYAPHTSGVKGSWRFRTTGVMTAQGGIVRAAVGGSVSHQTTNVGFSNTKERVSKRGPVVIMPVAQLGVALSALDLSMQGWWAAGAQVPTDGAYKGPGARMVAEVHLGKGPKAD